MQRRGESSLEARQRARPGVCFSTNTVTVNSQATYRNYCVAYDSNGNVAALVNATTGVESARYEYGPFGEVLRANGPACGMNPFRFSTKYQDDETDLAYYGYRYYNASMGRWLSRDPLGELGGLNLYGFLQNNGVNDYDLHGLIAWGPILKFAKECAIELLKKGALNEFDKWWDDAQACAALNEHAAGNPLIDLCKGVDFDVDFELKSKDDNLARIILGCVWKKATTKGIEKLLKNVEDEIEKKLLEKLLKEGGESLQDLVSQGKVGYQIRAYCSKGEPMVDLYFRMQLTIAGEPYDLKGKDIQSAQCGAFYRGLRGMCCCEEAK